MGTGATPARALARDVLADLAQAATDARDLLYPFECLVCGAGAEPAATPALCRACDAALPRREGAPPRLQVPAPALAGHVVALRLEEPASDLVYQLKYGAAAASALPLAALLAEAVRARALERELQLLVPVPAHWLKAWLRGIDHARVLTDELSRVLRIPTARALRGARATVAQGQARSAAERSRQVAGAFAPRRGRRLRGKVVGLVDDVVTSGATAAEAARALLSGGARAVYLLAAAGNG
jgi:ComF family protein